MSGLPFGERPLPLPRDVRLQATCQREFPRVQMADSENSLDEVPNSRHAGLETRAHGLNTNLRRPGASRRTSGGLARHRRRSSSIQPPERCASLRSSAHRRCTRALDVASGRVRAVAKYTTRLRIEDEIIHSLRMVFDARRQSFITTVANDRSNVWLLRGLSLSVPSAR